MTRSLSGALWIGLAAAALGPPAPSLAGEAKADSDWFFDDSADAGGATSNTTNTTWTLGNNVARIDQGADCDDPKPQISGTKAALSGMSQQLIAQCAASGSTALGDSRMAIAPAGGGGFLVTPSASARATASGIFTTEAEAEARYGDPLAFEGISPDFVLGVNVTLAGGAALMTTTGGVGMEDTASLSLTGFSDVSGLEELYTLSVGAGGDAPDALSCSFVSNAGVSMVDQTSGLPLSDATIESALCAAFSYTGGIQEHATAADLPLFRMQVPLGAAGVTEAVVGWEAENDAFAINALNIPALPGAAGPVLAGVLLLAALLALRRVGRVAA